MNRIHCAVKGKRLPLCNTPNWYSATANEVEVTCLRCLFFLGRYFPTADKDPERRAELLERQARLNR